MDATELQATEIGKSVNVVRKHASKDVRDIAKALIEYESLLLYSRIIKFK